ncbi:MAG: alpha/beta hydrolase [Caulobacterales bacterium]
MKAAIWALVGLILAAACPAAAQTPAPPAPRALDPAAIAGFAPSKVYQPPEGVTFRADDFISENVRLTAQWFYASDNAGKTLPTIIMAHGWGGTAAAFRRDAIDLARAGYLVMIFDYRGWGESDGRVVLTGPRPADAKPGSVYQADVRELRGYVDPWEQTEDWFNAISYAVTQPMVDVDRIGVRGSSYSGGHVVYVAAHEPRVKVLVSQVGSLDSRPQAPFAPDPAKAIHDANASASRLATGQEQYPADRAKVVGNLIGAPIGNKTLRWAPIEDAGRVTQPALFIMAQKEELFSNERSGVLGCERVRGPRKAIMVPGITHYGIYGAERDLAIKAAIDWFDRYLKAPGSPTRIPIDRGASERGDCHAPFARPFGTAPPAVSSHPG